MPVVPQDILTFWFGAPGSAEHGTVRAPWFAKDAAFDTEVKRRFGLVVEKAIGGGFVEWERNRDASLALLLLLDQFPRNIYRNDARAFSGDGRARSVADEAIMRGYDKDRPFTERLFFYLPFEHGERFLDQDRSLELISALGNKELTDYAKRHRDVILKFGRFPHRNKVLGRVSTPEEEAFLKLPGSTF